jgi:ubiquinone/menaquinone biosynthesis C-methylase UbiE
MSNRQQPLPEHPSTYVVADRSNQEELHRLHLQDQMLTESQGGVLPEQPDPTSFQRVLDVGCGTGGWLIEVAKMYPTVTLLIGVDVSRTFVEYARAQAEAGQVSDRVEFQVMDALRMLEFPTGFFDLVNQRLGQSWLRTWDWPKLLQEYQRVARVGGVVRIVESGATKTSPALTRFSELVLTALYQSGHYFAPDWTGVTNQLTRLLHQHGLQQVQVHEAALAYRAGTPRGHLYMEDVRRSLNTLQPFLEKWTRVPADYQALCSQVESEIQQPDFVATLQMLTAWGKVPSRKKEREDSPR